MNRHEAREGLRSQKIRHRLDAARYFARQATVEDAEFLSTALRQESVSWVRAALEVAVSRARRRQGEPEVREPALLDESVERELYAQATVETTSTLLHELEPLVGVLRLRLISEWKDFSTSRSDGDLERIEEFLTVMRDFNSAARVPTFSEVPLHVLLKAVGGALAEDRERKLDIAGPDLVVESSAPLVQIVVRNALRNAFEASPVAEPVVLTWGASRDEFFVAVLDSGPGVPFGAAQHAFEFGSTTKEGHLGTGLALAQQAAESLGGRVELASRREGGAKFELRCPKRS